MSRPTPHADSRAPVGLRVPLREQTLTQDLALLRAGVARGVLDGSGVVVDVSEVGKVSSAVVAAILWARRTCTTRNVAFRVVGHCGTTRKVLRSCGIRDEGNVGAGR